MTPPPRAQTRADFRRQHLGKLGCVERFRSAAPHADSELRKVRHFFHLRCYWVLDQGNSSLEDSRGVWVRKRKETEMEFGCSEEGLSGRWQGFTVIHDFEACGIIPFRWYYLPILSMSPHCTDISSAEMVCRRPFRPPARVGISRVSRKPS